MERLLRSVLVVLFVLVILGFFVGMVVVGLSILLPFLIGLAVLYGIFYIYQHSSFLQKIFGKSKKQQSASSVTTYYELDEYGKPTTSKTIVEVFEEDDKK